MRKIIFVTTISLISFVATAYISAHITIHTGKVKNGSQTNNQA
jgi:uncharacterized protein YcnI